MKETQHVTLDEIPMPELPSGSATDDANELPAGYSDAFRGILKQKEYVISKRYYDLIFYISFSSSMEQAPRIVITRKPPGPPPGRPPILSDNEDISDDEEGKYCC